MLGELFVKGSPAADVPVEFRDADGEVRFLVIYVDKGGSLGAVLRNRWKGRARGLLRGRRSGHYSLLPHARVLWINDNPGAVRDLTAYVAGEY